MAGSTDDATTAGLRQGQTSSLTLPTNTINEILNSQDIRIGFTIYRNADLFPVRDVPMQGSNQTTFIDSLVISAIVNGIPDGSQLTVPITVFLLLNNKSLPRPNQIFTRSCVFWNFTAAG